MGRSSDARMFANTGGPGGVRFVPYGDASSPRRGEDPPSGGVRSSRLVDADGESAAFLSGEPSPSTRVAACWGWVLVARGECEWLKNQGW